MSPGPLIEKGTTVPAQYQCVFFSLTTECFENAVRVSPEEGYSKYMNLGQLLEGQEAVTAFNKAIQLMIASKDDETSQVCVRLFTL